MYAYQSGMAVLAFELWDDLIAIDLNEVADENADITFAYSSETTNGGSYCYINSHGEGNLRPIDSSRIWLNTFYNDDSFIVLGRIFVVFMHEIGHGIGLSHPGTYNAGDVPEPNYEDDAEYAQDTSQFTIMSYFQETEYGNPDHTGADNVPKAPTTPLLHDIAAIQAKYGAGFTTHSGDTVYGFNSTADRVVYDFTINIDPILASGTAAASTRSTFPASRRTRRSTFVPGDICRSAR